MTTIVIVLACAGTIGSVVAFAFYSVRTIVKLSENKTWLVTSLTLKQVDIDQLSKDVLKHVDENARLKSAIKALESSNAKLLANSKFAPSDVVDDADERLRRLLPTP